MITKIDRTNAAERFGDRILWELPVQYVASDFLRSGDIAYDVGANVGGLSAAFSRLVGPTGSVVAFECNPPIIDVFKRTMALNSITNVDLVEKAAYFKSHDILEFGSEQSFYAAASSLLRTKQGFDVVKVETIALDDVRSAPPRLIKLDVEGTEFLALKGAERLISDARPIVILEYVFIPNPSEDPLVLLERHGYTFVDVNTYEPMLREQYRHVEGHSNVLAIPQEVRCRYRRTRMGKVLDLNRVPIQAGRWLLQIAMTGPGDAFAALKIEDHSGGLMALFMAPLDVLRQPANCFMVIEVDTPQQLRLSLASEVAGVRIEAAELFSVDKEF